MREQTVLTGNCGRLQGRLWTADRSVRGVVIVVHGLGDHSGSYRALAQHLTARQWAVFAFDQQGHGVSPGKRGHVESYDSLLADIAAARHSVARRLGPCRQVLLGHSMGGNLVLSYALRRGQFDTGVASPIEIVLAAPMLLPANPPDRPAVFAAWLSGYLLRWLRVHRRPATQGQDDLAADPHRHHYIGAYLATQLLGQGRWALDNLRRMDPMRTLILLGDRDDQVDRAACEYLPARMSGVTKLQRLPGVSHELFAGDQAKVFGCISDWIDRSAAPQRRAA